MRAEDEGSRARVRRTAAIIAAGALVFLAGCQGDDAGGSSRSSADAAPAAKVSLAVADGTADVSPVEPLQVAVSGGKLDTVTVVDGGGADVAGALPPPPPHGGASGLG